MPTTLQQHTSKARDRLNRPWAKADPKAAFRPETEIEDRLPRTSDDADVAPPVAQPWAVNAAKTTAERA